MTISNERLAELRAEKGAAEDRCAIKLREMNTLREQLAQVQADFKDKMYKLQNIWKVIAGLKDSESQLKQQLAQAREIAKKLQKTFSEPHEVIVESDGHTEGICWTVNTAWVARWKQLRAALAPVEAEKRLASRRKGDIPGTAKAEKRSVVGDKYSERRKG